MKLTVTDKQGASRGELEVEFAIIENGKGTQAVHDVVVAHRAAQRSGTACTKTMGEVSGSGKKPWRQKGTGRARSGSLRSPLWRGGGITFGPKPRDFSKKVTRKTRQLALRKALGERLKSGDVKVVEDLKLEAPKTKAILEVLSKLEVDGTVLLVGGEGDRNLHLASRNLKYVELATGQSLNTYQVLRSDVLIFTREAFQQVEERLKA